jgi:hypothetical protein
MRFNDGTSYGQIKRIEFSKESTIDKSTHVSAYFIETAGEAVMSLI